MSTATDPTVPRDLSTAPPDLVWQSWPLLDNATWSWCVVPGLLRVSWVVTTVTDEPTLGVAAAAALAIALWRLFLPVRYEIGLSGVCQIVLGQRSLLRWRRVRHVEVRQGGVMFFERRNVPTLDVLQTLYLPCAKHRDVVVRLMEKYLTLSANEQAVTYNDSLSTR